MSDSLDKLQALLLDHSPDYAAFRAELAEIQENLADEALAKSQALIRLSLALQGLEEKRAGTSDIAVLLRQVIRAYNHRLQIKRDLWQLLSSRERETGLRVTDDSDPNTVELQATPWRPMWLPGTEWTEIDQLKQRRFDTPAVGTGLLYALTRKTSKPFIHYQSEAQKIAVETSLFAPPGSTTLITLPTGGGKSLCIVLPAWLESGGGRVKGGTTLVVVPTVSLAYDQERHVSSYFAEATDPEYKPYSLTSATPQDVRDTIRKGLRYGTLPILYTSPESLLNSELYQICLEAAHQGTINRLVIDEVHLVETWGARFRTEFQLLVSYRQKLLKASQGQLRTLLLSATVSNSCKQTLEMLFASEEDELFTMQANRLRPEISYWFNYAPDPETRQVRVLEALRHLPRPVILYVTKPEDAENWVEFLRGEGFERIAAFSGRTESDERQRLINEWNRNQRDIMVATSAFGLGVDKSDIRTVIHAALSENVDRFYQEVGRGGRDGCSSISLVCLVEEDYQLAFSMTAAARITTSKAWGRWQGMWKTAQSFQQRGDQWLINTNAPPDYNLEMDESQLNQEWNEHVLLLMQRAGITSIADTRPTDIANLQNQPEKVEDSVPGWRLIRLLKPEAINGLEGFRDTVESHRQWEKQTISGMLQQMSKLASGYAGAGSGNLPDRCLAHQFADLYDPTALACGGCPSCRHRNREPYIDTTPIHPDIAGPEPSANYLNGDFRQRIGNRRVLKLVWDGPCEPGALKGFSNLLVDLVGVGFQQLILPADLLEESNWITDLVKQLAQHRRIPHRVVPETWLLNSNLTNKLTYPLPTVVLYPVDDESADQTYLALEHWLAIYSEPIWMVHIVYRALHLPSQLGKFLDRVDGLEENAQSFQDWLKRLQTSLLF